MHNSKVALGIDDGGKFVGYAAYSSPFVLEAGEIDVQNIIKKKLKLRRDLRGTRRSKLGSRPKRFDNRKSNISPCLNCGKNAQKNKSFCSFCARNLTVQEKDTVRKNPNFYSLPPPSIKAKKDRVLRVVRKLKGQYDIQRVIVEVAKFDFQKLRNPEISGAEYQKGLGYGYHTVKQALSFLYGYKCAYCGTENSSLEIEHINPRSRGGTDRWENLTLACGNCNKKKGNRTPGEAGMRLRIKPKSLQTFIYAAHVQAGKTYLVQELRKIFGKENLQTTTGSWTSYYRKIHNLEKSHGNDAIVIASMSFSQTRNKIDISKTIYHKVKPLSCEPKQKYKATIYPSAHPLNNQFALVNNRVRKKVVVNDSIRDRITGQQLYRGDLVQLDGITGRINKILSSGAIGILVSSDGTKTQCGRVPKNVKVLGRDRIIFENSCS